MQKKGVVFLVSMRQPIEQLVYHAFLPYSKIMSEVNARRMWAQFCFGHIGISIFPLLFFLSHNYKFIIGIG